MAWDTAIFHDVAGTTFRATPTLITWTECYSFLLEDNLLNADANPNDPSFALMEAYKTNNTLIYPGQKHLKYANAFATDVQLTTVGGQNDTVNLRELVTYMMPGDYCSVEYDSYQTTEQSSFAIDNVRLAAMPYNLTTIAYNSTDPLLQTNTLLPFVASMRIPAILQSMRVTQWEPREAEQAAPGSILGEPKPFWNSEGIWGCQAGELLWIGTRSSNEGVALHQRTYTFIRNRFGWHHFYALFQKANGRTPPDIVPVDATKILPNTPSVSSNGAGAFRMLVGKSFQDAFGNLKKPFNTGPNPASVPPLNDVGDFPTLPDQNFA